MLYVLYVFGGILIFDFYDYDFCQNIKISELRGNIHTRLEKLEQKNMDGIILAAAGLKRLKLESKIKEYLDYTKWIPAIGQGAIGIEMKKDSSIKSYIENLNHKETSICINTERMISKFFNASCETPLGAYAHLENKNINTLKNIEDIQEFKKKLQFVFQNPYDALNPRFTIRDILLEPLKSLMKD